MPTYSTFRYLSTDSHLLLDSYRVAIAALVESLEWPPAATFSMPVNLRAQMITWSYRFEKVNVVKRLIRSMKQVFQRNKYWS
jgi:hypothetical protein